MKTSTGGRPKNLGLRWIQLEPVGVHPRLDVTDALRHSLNEFQCRVRTTVAVNLRIVRIELAAKTTTLNH